MTKVQPPRQYSAIDVAFGSGKQRKFFFRAKTSDETVIHKIFRNQQYELGGLRRSNELKAFLARRKNTGKSPLVIDAGANIGASAMAMMPDGQTPANKEMAMANADVSNGKMRSACMHYAKAQKLSMAK